MSSSARYWVVIPAAGIGSRMNADRPKQYLELLGKTILEHTIERFCSHPGIEAIVVVISRHDTYWKNLEISNHPKVKVTEGGNERCHSVLNGLTYLAGFADSNDWVMVHDAARPCLSNQDLSKLIDKVSEHPVGGILASAARDTMKRSNENNEIVETVSRDRLWHALTPQVFKLNQLTSALKQAEENGLIVTDDAQAMELTGVKPLLIEGDNRNIKITQMSDLAVAEQTLGANQ